MTVQIRIENLDSSRRIDVMMQDVDREKGLRPPVVQFSLAAGESRTTHLHLAREIVVRESDPDTYSIPKH